MASWTVCVFQLSLWVVLAAGRRNQQNGLIRRLGLTERRLNDRINKIEGKVSDIEKNQRSSTRRDSFIGISNAARETLLQDVMEEFSLRYRQEIIQDIQQELTTTIAAKLVHEIVSEVSLANNMKQQVDGRPEVDLTTFTGMLQIQKVNIIHLESRIRKMFSQIETLFQERDKTIVNGRAKMEVCFDKDEILRCRFKPIEESDKDSAVDGTSTAAPVGGDRGGNGSFEQSSESRQLVVADYFYTPKALQKVDLITSKIQSTKAYSYVSDVAFHSKRKRLFYAENLFGKLSSSSINGSDVKHYPTGNSIAYKIALDVDEDLLFYVTNFPYSLCVYDLENGDYVKQASFAQGEKPTGIAVDTDGMSVFVLIRLHTGSSEVRRLDYEGRQETFRLRSQLHMVTGHPDITAVAFGDGRLWYNRGRHLLTMTRADGFLKENFVIRINGLASDMEIKSGRVYIAYQENQMLDVLEKGRNSNYETLRRLKYVVGRGGHGRSICLIDR